MTILCFIEDEYLTWAWRSIHRDCAARLALATTVSTLGFASAIDKARRLTTFLGFAVFECDSERVGGSTIAATELSATSIIDIALSFSAA
jgi:hypothetical protein